MSIIKRYAVLILFILLILQFLYFSIQISLIKDVVTQNAEGANKRAEAQNYILLKTLNDINDLKNSIKK